MSAQAGKGRQPPRVLKRRFCGDFAAKGRTGENEAGSDAQPGMLSKTSWVSRGTGEVTFRKFAVH